MNEAMSHAARRLLCAPYLQSISSPSRHQLRTKRLPPVYTSSQYRGRASHRAFTSSHRIWQEKDEGLNIEENSSSRPEDTMAKTSPADQSSTTLDAAEATSVIDQAAQPELAGQVVNAIDPTQEETTAVDELAVADADAAEVKAAASEETGGIMSYFEHPESSGKKDPAKAQLDVDTATILPHGESEAHRDLREYARLAAWELPLLHKLKKPFQPPTSTTPLRFRYTSYMGDEHPAAKKVVVEFKPSELPGLDQQQQIKLIKLVGTRYNPEKQQIKMSCETFETPAQNKRYLGDLIQKLVHEAKNSKDTFADVPVDLRHHKQKPVYKFPEEWKIVRPARMEEGKGMRGKGLKKRERIQKLQETGKLVDGVKIIEEAMASLPVQRIARRPGEKTVLGLDSKKSPARGRLRSSTGRTS